MFSLACSMRGAFQMMHKAIPRTKSSFSSSLVGDMMMAVVCEMAARAGAGQGEDISETCLGYSYTVETHVQGLR